MSEFKLSAKDGLNFTEHTIEIPFGSGKTLTLKTGKLAKQAAGSILAQVGETVVLVATCVDTRPTTKDFFPLMVDYREKFYAGGRIPGGFFKREARPSDGETLKARLIDRTIRPMFPEGFMNEVQIYITILATDKENPAELVAMAAASAALHISETPFVKPIAGTRIGRIDDQFVVNPTLNETEESSLDLVVAGHVDGINMVECGAEELSEDQMVEAIELAQTQIKTIVPEEYKLPQTLYVVLRFVEELTDFIAYKENLEYKGHRRVLEGCKVELSQTPPDIKQEVELGRILLEKNATRIRDARDPLDPRAIEHAAHQAFTALHRVLRVEQYPGSQSRNLAVAVEVRVVLGAQSCASICQFEGEILDTLLQLSDLAHADPCASRMKERTPFPGRGGEAFLQGRGAARLDAWAHSSNRRGGPFMEGRGTPLAGSLGRVLTAHVVFRWARERRGFPVPRLFFANLTILIVSVVDARTHHEVEPRSRHAPVRILVRAHVVVVVMLEMLPGPRRIEVRPAMREKVVHAGVPDRGRKPGRHGEQRPMQHHQADDTERFLALGVIAKDAAPVVGVVEVLLAAGPVVLAPVKTEEAALLLAQAVEHIFVDQPLAGVRVQEPQRNSDHDPPPKQTVTL